MPFQFFWGWRVRSPFCVRQIPAKNSVEKISGILVFEYWPTQPWFPKLTHLLVDHPILLSCRQRGAELRTHQAKDMSKLPIVRLTAALVSGQRARLRAFLKRLEKSCRPHGGNQPGTNKPLTYVNGFSFAMRGKQIPSHLFHQPFFSFDSKCQSKYTTTTRSQTPAQERNELIGFSLY